MLDSTIYKKRKLNYNEIHTTPSTINAHKSLPISEYKVIPGFLPNKSIVIDFIKNVGLLTSSKRINVIEIIDGTGFLDLLGNREFMDKSVDQRSTSSNRIVEEHFYSDRWIKEIDYYYPNKQCWKRDCIYSKVDSNSNLGLFKCYKSMQSLPNYLKDHLFSSSIKIVCKNVQSVLLEQLLYSYDYLNFEPIKFYNSNYQKYYEELNYLKELNALPSEMDIEPLFFCILYYALHCIILGLFENGGCEFLENLKNTIDQISIWVYNQFPLITSSSSVDSHFEIHHLNLITLIQTIVSEIVLLEVDFFKWNDRTITLIENDQLRLHGDKSIVSTLSLLSLLKKSIHERSGFWLEFTFSSNTTLVLPPNFKPFDDFSYGGRKLKYEQLKVDADKNCNIFALCKVDSTKSAYYRFVSLPYELQTMGSKSELYNLKFSFNGSFWESKEKPFIDKWFNDCNAKTYNCKSLFPKGGDIKSLTTFSGLYFMNSVSCCNDLGVKYWNLMQYIFGILFGDKSRELNFFYHWVNQLLNYPMKKPRVAILVHSYTQGIGKTVIGNLLMKLVGPNYSYRIDENIELLASDFNGSYRDNKIFTFIDEIPSLKQESMEKIRGVISETEASIHFKNKDCYNAEVYDHLFITSQHSPCLNRSERRMVVIESNGMPLSAEMRVDVDTICNTVSIQSYIGRKLSNMTCYYSQLGMECFCNNNPNCDLEEEAKNVTTFRIEEQQHDARPNYFMLLFLCSLNEIASNHNITLSSLWLSNKWIVECYKNLTDRFIHNNTKHFDTVSRLCQDSFRLLELFKFSHENVKKTVDKKQIRITTGLLFVSNFNDLSSHFKSTFQLNKETGCYPTSNLKSNYNYTKIIDNIPCEGALIFSEYTNVFKELEIKQVFQSFLQKNLEISTSKMGA